PSEISKQLATRLIKSLTRTRKARIILIAAGGVVILAAWVVLKLVVGTSGSSSSINKSVAVLPLVNLGDSENDYYSDGISLDIASGLSKLPRALVISRKSSFFYKGKKTSDSTIAAELGVRYLVKGELSLL